MNLTEDEYNRIMESLSMVNQYCGERRSCENCPFIVEGACIFNESVGYWNI